MILSVAAHYRAVANISTKPPADENHSRFIDLNQSDGSLYV
jgi:hypothetical protein